MKICVGDCPFASGPSPTSADASGEVSDCAAGYQEVSMCSTRGESRGMYIVIRKKMRYQWYPKKDMCPPKTFLTL